LASILAVNGAIGNEVGAQSTQLTANVQLSNRTLIIAEHIGFKLKESFTQPPRLHQTRMHIKKKCKFILAMGKTMDLVLVQLSCKP
jgi:hypothetical protein